MSKIEKYSKEWYLTKQEKIAVVGGKRCRVTYHHTETRMGSYERGLKWRYSRWALLIRLSDHLYSMDHGKTWHHSPQWAMKSKGKIKLKSELEQEFAFNQIQQINREWEGPGYQWRP